MLKPQTRGTGCLRERTSSTIEFGQIADKVRKKWTNCRRIAGKLRQVVQLACNQHQKKAVPNQYRIGTAQIKQTVHVLFQGSQRKRLKRNLLDGSLCDDGNKIKRRKKNLSDILLNPAPPRFIFCNHVSSFHAHNYLFSNRVIWPFLPYLEVCFPVVPNVSSTVQGNSQAGSIETFLTKSFDDESS